jgi:hypothetical protein
MGIFPLQKGEEKSWNEAQETLAREAARILRWRGSGH